MSLEKNKAIVRKMFEAINKQNLASLDKLMAPDFVLHMHTQQTKGWKVNRQVVEGEIKAFPDFHVAIEDIIAEGDKVCVRLQETGTHRGEYRGLAPTGNKLSYTVIAIWRIVEGKIAEGWIAYDQLDFLKQLSVIEWKGFPDEHIANWQSGDSVVVPPPTTVEAAEERLKEGYECKDWYLCMKNYRRVKEYAMRISRRKTRNNRNNNS